MPSRAQIDPLLIERGIDPEQVVDMEFNHISRRVSVRYLKPATVAAGTERTIIPSRPELAELVLPWPDQ